MRAPKSFFGRTYARPRSLPVLTGFVYRLTKLFFTLLVFAFTLLVRPRVSAQTLKDNIAKPLCCLACFASLFSFQGTLLLSAPSPVLTSYPDAMTFPLAYGFL
jgi:hypothetical protein